MLLRRAASTLTLTSRCPMQRRREAVGVALVLQVNDKEALCMRVCAMLCLFCDVFSHRHLF